MIEEDIELRRMKKGKKNIMMKKVIGQNKMNKGILGNMMIMGIK